MVDNRSRDKDVAGVGENSIGRHERRWSLRNAKAGPRKLTPMSAKIAYLRGRKSLSVYSTSGRGHLGKILQSMSHKCDIPSHFPFRTRELTRSKGINMYLQQPMVL